MWVFFLVIIERRIEQASHMGLVYSEGYFWEMVGTGWLYWALDESRVAFAICQTMRLMSRVSKENYAIYLLKG